LTAYFSEVDFIAILK